MELAAAEIGPVLRLSRHAATDRVAFAEAVVSRLPGTLEALASGDLDLARVRVIVAATEVVDDAQAAAVEARVLPRAGLQTAPGLRASCARAVIAVDPEAARRRHEHTVANGRSVRLFPAEDGMATVWARLAAAEALTAYRGLCQLAEHAKTDGDDRTADARRADTLVDLLSSTDARGVCPSTAPTERHRDPDRPAAVRVTVDWATLAGLDDQPAHLTGYGPVTAEAARQIAADATWRRVLTDPVSGTVLDVGRTSYQPPAALAEHVRTRDDSCRFPGCRRPATRTDLDHTVEYPAGPTADHNLAALCRTHHRIKTHSRWQVAQPTPGTLLWTSPTGQRYSTDALRLDPDRPDPP